MTTYYMPIEPRKLPSVPMEGYIALEEDELNDGWYQRNWRAFIRKFPEFFKVIKDPRLAKENKQ